MGDPFVKMTDSGGQTVVLVRDKVTRLVSAGDAYTEVHLVDGSFVRIPRRIDDVTSQFWTTEPAGDDAARKSGAS